MPHPPFLPNAARPVLAFALVALPLFLTACEQEPNGSSTAGPSDSEAIVEAEPFAEWINLDGRVVSAGPSEFLLDYGRGRINVEVDGWRFYDRGKGLRPGDRVQVSGRLDENFFAANTIEADSVYVKNRDTVYYGNAVDEEGIVEPRYFALGDIDVSTSYIGPVTGKTPNGFTLGAGAMKIAVDASHADTPVAGRIEAGDRVYVWGDLEVGDNGDSRFEADGVVELTADADADGATATERDAPAAAPEAS